MKVYVFTSESLTNVWAGVGAQTWAVPLSSSENSNKGRATKASRMPVGAIGILYCSAEKCFTSPFVVHSKANPDQIVEHIWPGKWFLPFSIRSLGNPHARLTWAEAAKSLPSCANGQPLNKLLHMEPLTVFTADEISEEDWSFLVARLSN